MRLRFVLIGPDEGSAALAAALVARGHAALHYRPAAAADLASARGRLADADAVILDAATPDLPATARLVLASSVGWTALLCADAAGLAAGLSADAPPPVPLDGFGAVLSPLGGPALRQIERSWSARRAVAFYPAVTAPPSAPAADPEWALGCLDPPSQGTRAAFERLFLAVACRYPARRFLAAGQAGPDWPGNVDALAPPPPGERAELFGRLAWSLHLAEPAPARTGFCPARSMFEAAASGAGVIAEGWTGLGTLLAAGSECVLAGDTQDVASAITRAPALRRAIAAAGRARILAEHRPGHRADQLESLVMAADAARRVRPPRRWVG